MCVFVSQDKDIEGEEEEEEAVPAVSKVNRLSSQLFELNVRFEDTVCFWKDARSTLPQLHTWKKKAPQKIQLHTVTDTHTHDTHFMAAVTEGSPYPLINLPHMHRRRVLVRWSCSVSRTVWGEEEEEEVKRRRWLRLHCLSVNTPARLSLTSELQDSPVWPVWAGFRILYLRT